MQEKAILRQQLNRILQGIPPAERRRKSLQIAARITGGPWWDSAGVVCGYLSFGNEVETRPLLREVTKQNKILGVPRLRGKQMDFHRVSGTGGNYIRHPYGMEEPAPGTPLLELAPSSGPVLLIIPGTAFDRKGRRLGKGGGFYDRFLDSLNPGVRCLCLGICFSEQLVPRVPVTVNDKAMDLVITELEVIQCSGVSWNF